MSTYRRQDPDAWNSGNWSEGVSFLAGALPSLSNPNPAMVEHFSRGEDIADVEWPELGVAGAGFVEPHAVDDFLEELRVAGPQRDAPFPILEAQADGDE